MKKTCALFVLLNLTNAPLFCFSTLKDIQQYAETHSEAPPMDTKDWTDPDYSAYQRAQQPTVLSKTIDRVKGFLRTIGVADMLGLAPASSELWTPQKFEELLVTTLAERTKRGWSGRTVAYLPYSCPTRIFVWGDMHGAFHSLTRCLTWFEKEGIIDNDLRILKPQHYFVFNGDAINRTAYTLETLSVLMLLLQKNPKHVIYIRGKHEDKGHWENYALERELRIKLHHRSDEITPLVSEIDLFFKTLPLAFYASPIENRNELIRVSHIGRKTSELAEEFYGTLFQASPPNKISYRHLKDQSATAHDIDVRVIIKTEDWRKERRALEGLGQLDQDLGATSWTILSSPIPVHQEYLKFYFDAFGVIDCAIPLRKATISLYNRDVRTKDDFKKSASFNIVTGIPTDATIPLPEKDLFIGSSMALVSGVAVIGERVKRGMSVRINKENRNGGVKNHHLRTRIYNDNYEPDLARQNVKHLINEGIDILLLPIGSPTLNSYLDFVHDKKVGVLFPVTGSSQFRSAELKGIVNLRATYANEVHALVDFVITEFSSSKFAFLYEHSSYGLRAVDEAHNALKEKNITSSSWLDLPYGRGTVHFEQQVEAAVKTQIDAFGFFATAGAVHEFMRQYGIHRFANKTLFGISFIGEESLRQFIKKHNIPFLFGAVVPNPWISDLPIVKEYRAEMDANNFTYDVFSLEAYIATSLLIDTLKKIEGDITKDKILAELEKLNNYEFGGFNLTFNPERRSLARYVWLETSTEISKTVSASFARTTGLTSEETEWVRKEIKQ